MKHLIYFDEFFLEQVHISIDCIGSYFSFILDLLLFTNMNW